MPSKHLKVGITGGIGAGKSVVCKIFKSLNIPVYDADSSAKQLMQKDLRQEIVDLFGPEAFSDGILNKTHIAQKAFYHPDLLEQLNGLVHPAVALDYDKWVNGKAEFSYSLKEAALLFEAGSYKMLDRIILVTAPEKLRTARVLNRDPHRTEKDVKKIIEKQWSEDEKSEKSDFILKNDESALVIPQVLNIHERLLKEAGR